MDAMELGAWAGVDAMRHIFALFILGVFLIAASYMRLNYYVVFAMVGGFLFGHALVEAWRKARESVR